MKRLMPILLLTLVLLTLLPVRAANGTYYTLRAARVRSCASTFCDYLGSIQANEPVEIANTVDGQKWNGSKKWYQIIYQDLTGYVHSSLLTTLEPGRLFTPGAPTPAPIDIRPYLVGPSLIVTGAPLPVATAITLTPGLTSVPPAQQYVCNGLDDLDCSNFANQREANAHLQQCGVDEDLLDANNDGLACEALPP